MAGTLVIDTLQDGSGNSTSATNAIQGSAKAWVNFSGASATIAASYNVSSITRNGVGDYTINFTNALADGNYSMAGMCEGWTTTNGGYLCVHGSASTPSAPTLKTASAVRVQAYVSQSIVQDNPFIGVAILR